MNPRVFGMTLAAFSISTIIFLVVGIQIKEYELLSPKRPGQEASLPLYLKSEQLSKRSAIEGLCRNNDYDVLVEMMRGKGK
jgi:hypothetical protein